MSEEQQPLNALPKGHRLQEYELVRVLGVGGFGMTYLALDDNLNKGFAIKEYLPSDLATRTADGSVAPQTELKELLCPLLDGLAVVHGADFLYRDIKPEQYHPSR